MTKTHFSKAAVSQTMRFYREGSALAGTLQGGPIELVASVSIESDEPAERIRRLVKLAEASCYAQQSLTSPMPVTTTATLNGAPIDL